VLNVSGFYDPLLAFLDGAVRQQFIKPVHRDLVMSAGSAGVLLDRLSAHRPRVTTPKWSDTAET
jgi:predicted Rossmann-fold nucleotide-binding protein